jgi:hypothetical protein
MPNGRPTSRNRTESRRTPNRHYAKSQSAASRVVTPTRVMESPPSNDTVRDFLPLVTVASELVRSHSCRFSLFASYSLSRLPWMSSVALRHRLAGRANWQPHLCRGRWLAAVGRTRRPACRADVGIGRTLVGQGWLRPFACATPHGYPERGAGARLRALLHHQATGSKHRTGAQPSPRLRGAGWRGAAARQQARTRH